MLYTGIFVSLYVIGWLVCGFVPWLALSVATRGNAGLAMLPLCLFAAVVAGFAVPVFGLTGVTGFWLSFVAAVAVPALLLLIRRFSLHTMPRHEATHGTIAPTQEEPRTK